MVKIIEPSVEILTPLDGEAILKHIESCARNCYKSEDNITADGQSAKKMVQKLIELNHLAMIEHFSVTAKITCDIGVYKDLTRHRIASFAIESTRYCNYSKGRFDGEISVIKPCHITDSKMYAIWLDAMSLMEQKYMEMAKMGAKPDQLRMLLPHSTKADVIMTANLREWRHVFSLRCSPFAHPSVQQVMKMLLHKMNVQIPILFDDLAASENSIPPRL